MTHILNKPDWKDAPDWANYLAQDEDGSWYWYEMEPDFGSNCYNWSSYSKYKLAYTTRNPEWKTTLEKKP